MVEFLLRMGSNVNAKTVKEVTPLMLAAYSGSIETVRLLLRKKANVYDESDFG